MKIGMNKDIDAYKEDFYKGMDARQVGFAVLVIIMGGGAFFAAQYVFHVPQILSVYVAMVFAAPPAVIGFIPVCYMPVLKYLACKRKVMDNAVLLYDCGNEFETEIQEDLRKEGRTKKRKKSYGRYRSWEEVYFDDIRDENVEEPPDDIMYPETWYQPSSDAAVKITEKGGNKQ